MSKIYELYIQLLIQTQHSPTIQTISRYEPDNFINNQNPLSMADQIRVLRFRSQKIIFKESTLQQYITLFQQNRNLYIHFLRRLTSPIFDHELQDQNIIENIILQIELDSILLEQLGLWQNLFNLKISQLETLFLCQNMKQFIENLIIIKQNQLKLINQISENDLINETQKQNLLSYDQVDDYYKQNYKINSKKKIIQFTHKNELCESDQLKIIKIIQKKRLSNIREIFQTILNQFGLQTIINYQESNNEWYCELHVKEIYTKQKSQNKQQSYLNAQIHILKQISPQVFDYIIENSSATIDEIKQNKGQLNLKIPINKQFHLIPQETYLKQLPYNYELIENYIENLNSNETCSIRKLQNDITNFLITKYHQFGINKQLLSIASTYELTMQFLDGKETRIINKTFKTKLRYYNARLIGQQYIINVIGELIFGRDKCDQFEIIEQFLQQFQ